MAADSVINRKALRDFHIRERYEAGIELKGSEVKSIRAGKANISDAFARIGSRAGAAPLWGLRSTQKESAAFLPKACAQLLLFGAERIGIRVLSS